MSIYYGTSKDLAFRPDNLKSWLVFLEQNNGKKLVVDIKRETGRRSGIQNNWLWGVVYKVIADHTGYTENEIHSIMKKKFLPKKFKLWKGQEIEVENSTTGLSKVEFGEYVDRIRAEVASMGVVIPNPEEKADAPLEYPKESHNPTF